MIKFKDKRLNPALQYWHDCVENITEDGRISPRDMLDFHTEVSGFLIILEESDDTRRLILERKEMFKK